MAKAKLMKTCVDRIAPAAVGPHLLGHPPARLRGAGEALRGAQLCLPVPEPRNGPVQTNDSGEARAAVDLLSSEAGSWSRPWRCHRRGRLGNGPAREKKSADAWAACRGIHGSARDSEETTAKRAQRPGVDRQVRPSPSRHQESRERFSSRHYGAARIAQGSTLSGQPTACSALQDVFAIRRLRLAVNGGKIMYRRGGAKMYHGHRR